MKSKFINLCIITLLGAMALLPATTSQAQQIIYQEDFEDGQAQGWDLEPGWQVTQVEDNYFLYGEGHTWARSNQIFEDDLQLSFRIKILEGRIHLVVYLTDASRYFIGFDANGSDLNKQYFPDEFYDNLAISSAPHGLDHWYQVEIVLRGSTIEFLVDGAQEWSYTDPQPLAGGSFAFETLDDSLAYVDDIRVEVEATPTTTRLPTSSLTWVRTGGPLGGLGYDIRMRPDNPDILFVTDAFSGVHKSTDGGATWFPSNDGITGRQGNSSDGIPVFCLTIDPNNNDIVWAGLQWLGQLYRSTDGGQTWEKRSTGVLEREGLTFRGITIEPGNSDVVYAAGEISPERWAGHSVKGLGFDLTKGVLYKSTDSGLHWTAIWRGDNLARYIWIDPTDVETLYLSTGIFDREAANSDPSTKTPGGAGIIKSTDGGLTWTQINDGLGNLYIGSLFMHPTDPNILLAGAGNNAYLEGSGVYLTTDGGAHWQLVLDTGDVAVTSVEFSISDPNIAYAGGQHVFAVSNDGGLNWEHRERDGRWGPPGILPGFPIDFQVDPRDPFRIFANNYGGGNFLSEDGGTTWISASTGYTGADLRSISVDPRYSGIVYTNGRSGPFISQDGGLHWQGINPEDIAPIVEGSQIIIDPDDPMHLLMTESNGTEYYVGRILWSIDGGHTWHESTNDWGNLVKQEGIILGGVEALAFAPSRPSRVYAGFGNNGCKGFGEGCHGLQSASTVAVSDDGGRSWTAIQSLPENGRPVTAVVVHPDDPQQAWVALPSFGLYMTMDGGASWKRLSQGLGSAQVMSLAVEATNGDVLYAGTLDRGVYRSVDGGETWRQSSNGMDPNEPIYTIAINPVNPDHIYAGSLRSGVFQSEDSGKTWIKINNGLFMRSVHDLAFSSDGGTLYAATYGGGVYRLDLNGQLPLSPPGPPQTPAPTNTTPSDVASPTPAPTNKPAICGGGATLPLAILGLIWWKALRKRVRK